MLELKVDVRDGTPRIMEMNPRFWGSLALAVASGVGLAPLSSGARGAAAQPAGLPARRQEPLGLGDLDHLVIRLGGREEADLPPGSPTRLGAVIRFLNPFAGRPEVFALGDPEPLRGRSPTISAGAFRERRAEPGPGVSEAIETGGPAGSSGCS